MEYKRERQSYDINFKYFMSIVYSVIINIFKLLFKTVKVLFIPFVFIFGDATTFRYWIVGGLLFVFTLIAWGSYSDPSNLLYIDFIGLFLDTYDFIKIAIKNILFGSVIVVVSIVGFFFAMIIMAFGEMSK